MIISNLGFLQQGVHWDISNASYDSKSYDPTTQVGNLTANNFSDDGTKMYALDSTNDTVFQYTLSTAWDVSTASYASKSADVSSEETTASSVRFSTDGTKMYVLGTVNDTVFQYTLSTAWDVSTASYASKSLSVSSYDSDPVGISFKTDGTKMYITGFGSNRINQLSLSTAWDVSTGTTDSKSLTVTSQEGTPYTAFFSTSGLRLFIAGTVNDTVFQYTLSTAWDVSTASYDTVSFDATTQQGTVTGLSFDEDGTKMYISGNNPNKIFQYSL